MEMKGKKQPNSDAWLVVKIKQHNAVSF